MSKRSQTSDTEITQILIHMALHTVIWKRLEFFNDLVIKADSRNEENVVLTQHSLRSNRFLNQSNVVSKQ